ncbi:hypothetical protein HYS50_03485 [Candidatus Woesearchaeota archaeon]|nr:hypothetical protein [Candidatus Woesearchaeota archaeon]
MGMEIIIVKNLTKKLIFLVLLIVSLIFISSYVNGQKSNQISVELDIPDYIPDAETLRQPTKFFSGQPLRLVGNFSGLNLQSVQVEIRGKETGIQRTLEVRRATPLYVSVDIPPEIPNDLYDLILKASEKAYETTIQIYGFVAEELQHGEGGGGGMDPQELTAAVLYTSEVDCGPEPNEVFFEGCYWESVLAGHPKDPNLLVLTGIAGHLPNEPPLESIQVSHDGGRTWNPGSFEGIKYHSDPSSLVTPEGTFLLAANGAITSSCRAGTIVGAFYQGPVTGSVFTSTLFKKPPQNLNLNDCLASDYPKIAYDSETKTIYISAFAVKFEDGTIGQALFVSRDGGKSFTEQKLEYAVRKTRSPLLSVDVNQEGLLRAVVVFDGRFQLLRFDRKAETFDIVPGLDMYRHGIARVSATSLRYWLVYEGPEIAIDKSSQHPGRIYIVWAVAETIVKDPSFSLYRYGKNYDIFLAYSDDDGITWSQRQKVNDDTGQADQVFPSIDADSSGAVHITFLDKRENPDLPQYDVYYAKVVDGRVSRNIRVNLYHVPSGEGELSIGDYLKMVVAYPDKVYVSHPCSEPIPQDLSPNHPFRLRPMDACVSAVDPDLVPFQGEFRRGDSNQDFIVDISDAINTLEWLYLGTGQVPCQDAADTNDDGKVDITDAINTFGFLFKGDPKELPQPFPGFGKDTTDDGLDCK